MKVRVATVMMDANDTEAIAAFWCQLLGLEETARHPGYIWTQSMGEGGPRLAFQHVPEPKAVKNRVHLDLYVDDPEAFVTQVEELGGTRIADHESHGSKWTVLGDPEGNEFCVTKTK